MIRSSNSTSPCQIAIAKGLARGVTASEQLLASKRSNVGVGTNAIASPAASPPASLASRWRPYHCTSRSPSSFRATASAAMAAERATPCS